MRSVRCHVRNRLAIGKEWSWKTVYLMPLLSPTWWGDGKSFLKKKHFRQYGSASFCLKAKNTFDERIKFLRQAMKAGAQLLGLPTLSLISLAFTLGRPLNRPNPWTTFGEGCLYWVQGGLLSILHFKVDFGWWRPDWASFALFSWAFYLGDTTARPSFKFTSHTAAKEKNVIYWARLLRIVQVLYEDSIRAAHKWEDGPCGKILKPVEYLPD